MRNQQQSINLIIQSLLIRNRVCPYSVCCEQVESVLIGIAQPQRARCYSTINRNFVHQNRDGFCNNRKAWNQQNRYRLIKKQQWNSIGLRYYNLIAQHIYKKGDHFKSEQQKIAESASAWLMPWERRHLDDNAKGMNLWEQIYWSFFAMALTYVILINAYRYYTGTPAPEEKIDEELERRKQQFARIVLSGNSIIEGDDPYEGMTPEQIDEYVKSVAGTATQDDPFDGMSPEEIDQYVQQSKQLQSNAQNSANGSSTTSASTSTTMDSSIGGQQSA